MYHSFYHSKACQYHSKRSEYGYHFKIRLYFDRTRFWFTYLRSALRTFLCLRNGRVCKNLRRDLYYKVQDFSFANIDKFSTPSLVTRLTTDVTNVQQAFMMIIRIAVRAPLMLVFFTYDGLLS